MAVAFRLIFIPAYSLLSRISKGEGALFALTLAFYLRFENSGSPIWPQLCGMASTIAMMYALNDIHDAPPDSADATRRNAWTLAMAGNRGLAYSIHIVESVGLALVLFSMKIINLPAYAAATGVSVGYSFWAKRKAGFDFLAVCLWGPAFILAFVAHVPVWYLVNAGMMLAMSHAFQMYRDRSIDAANRITTSAVKSSLFTRYVFYAAGIVVVSGFFFSGRYASAALSTLSPLVTVWLGFTRSAWLTVKAGQLGAWLLALL